MSRSVHTAIKKAADQRGRRLELRRAGICTLCLRVASSEGFSTCRPCRVRARSSRRTQYVLLRSLGICVQCADARAERPHVLCAECRRVMALKQRERVLERKAG